MEDFQEPRSLGWDSINEALRPIYCDTEPMHWGTIISWELGGPDPIRGISACRRYDPEPYLHYVTFGFSELYEKESDNPAVSGWGFELTFRLAHNAQADPPNWVLNFLQNLGRYVFETGRVFGDGHHMTLNGPIAQGSDTKIRAIGFVLDPELGFIDTPNGQVDFLQVVGLTEDELAAIECWNGKQFLDLARGRNEMLLTDLGRSSYLEDADFGLQVEERTLAEGASSDALYCDHARVEWDDVHRPPTLVLGALIADNLARRLKGRLPFGREFSIYTDDTEVRFEPGENFEWRPIDQGLAVKLTAAQADVLLGVLRPKESTHTLPELSGLTVVIEKTLIKDSDGKVVKTVG